jgi:hypothetical protein
MALNQAASLSKVRDKLRGSYKKLSPGGDDDLAVDQDETSQLRFESRPRRISRCHVLVISLLLLATSSIVMIIIFNTDNRAKYHNLRPINASASPSDNFAEWIDCGHTAFEARDRGCVFDLMLSTWIHESCYDDEMMNKYLLEGNHSYFYDEDMMHEMPEEEARRGEYKTLWTDGEFHLRHCVYLMDMQLRSYVTGRPIEVSIYNFGHTQHCVNMTLWHDRDGKKTRLHGKCGYPKER